MRGLFFIDRNVFDHRLFKNEPFTEREAWIWMLSEAAWNPRRIRTKNGALVDVERGQFSHSIRFMAEKWQWHRARVERFLNRLKTETAIGTANDTGQLVVTICNYEKYQGMDNFANLRKETQSETAARQQRDKEEHNKHNTPPLTPPGGNDDFSKKRGSRKKGSNGENGSQSPAEKWISWCAEMNGGDTSRPSEVWDAAKRGEDWAIKERTRVWQSMKAH